MTKLRYMILPLLVPALMHVFPSTLHAPNDVHTDLSRLLGPSEYRQDIQIGYMKNRVIVSFEGNQHVVLLKGYLELDENGVRKIETFDGLSNPAVILGPIKYGWIDRYAIGIAGDKEINEKMLFGIEKILAGN